MKENKKNKKKLAMWLVGCLTLFAVCIGFVVGGFDMAAANAASYNYWNENLPVGAGNNYVENVINIESRNGKVFLVVEKDYPYAGYQWADGTDITVYLAETNVSGQITNDIRIRIGTDPLATVQTTNIFVTAYGNEGLKMGEVEITNCFSERGMPLVNGKTYRYYATSFWEDVDGVSSRYMFSFNDGSGLSFVHTGVEIPTAPEKNGYAFVGWFYDEELTNPYGGEEITSDISLYAKYELQTYKIEYNLDLGTLVSPVTSYTIESETISLPVPTRVGYAFKGWYTADDFSGDEVTEIPAGSFGDVVYYAKWEVKKYNVTFYVDGEVYFSLVVEHGSVLNNYYFIDKTTMQTVGLYNNANMTVGYDISSEIVDNVNIYASGAVGLYASLTYMVDGEEIAVDLLDYNSVLGDLRVPTLDGYDFAGWYYDEDFTSLVKTTDKITGNITVFAKFVPTENISFWGRVGRFFTSTAGVITLIAVCAVALMGVIGVVVKKKK